MDKWFFVDASRGSDGNFYYDADNLQDGIEDGVRAKYWVKVLGLTGI